MTEKKNKFDLEERIATFAEHLILFLKKIRLTSINQNIVAQLIRSGTSIGANYFEADVAESKKDFQHKIGICKKEAKESCYWLRLLAQIHPELKNEIRRFYEEAHAFVLIFTKSIATSRKNSLGIRN